MAEIDIGQMAFDSQLIAHYAKEADARIEKLIEKAHDNSPENQIKSMMIWVEKALDAYQIDAKYERIKRKSPHLILKANEAFARIDPAFLARKDNFNSKEFFNEFVMPFFNAWKEACESVRL